MINGSPDKKGDPFIDAKPKASIYCDGPYVTLFIHTLTHKNFFIHRSFMKISTDNP